MSPGLATRPRNGKKPAVILFRLSWRMKTMRVSRPRSKSHLPQRAAACRAHACASGVRDDAMLARTGLRRAAHAVCATVLCPEQSKLCVALFTPICSNYCMSYTLLHSLASKGPPALTGGRARAQCIQLRRKPHVCRALRVSISIASATLSCHALGMAARSGQAYRESACAVRPASLTRHVSAWGALLKWTRTGSECTQAPNAHNVQNARTRISY